MVKCFQSILSLRQSTSCRIFFTSRVLSLYINTSIIRRYLKYLCSYTSVLVRIKQHEILDIRRYTKYLRSIKSVRIWSYSGPYFPTFRLNTERYGVSLRIQSECGKIQARITPNTDTFHTVLSPCAISKYILKIAISQVTAQMVSITQKVVLFKASLKIADIGSTVN